MEATGMAPEREEEAESTLVAASVWATVAVTRTLVERRAGEAASAQSPEGTRTAWDGASMGGARAVGGVVVAVAVGAEAKVPVKAATTMGTTEAVTMG